MATLLVINDDPVQLHFLASVLEHSHEQVIRFTCSRSAWQWLQAGHSPDLIVLDLHMPGINGWRFCELLHTEAHSGHSVPPVLIVSATYSGMDAESLLADIGASAFLPMPAEPARIRDQVTRLLEAPSSPKGFRLWIVSANDHHLVRIRSAFVARGWHVQGWQNGTQMFAAGALPKPDILIIDHPLTDATTQEVLSWCRRDCPDAMCIELRSHVDGDSRRYVLGKEADFCLPRECDAQEILAHCEKWRWERALTRVEHLLEVRTSDLKESEAQFQDLFEILPDILVIYDDQGIIGHINASGAEQLGYTPDMLIGRTLSEIHPHFMKTMSSASNLEDKKEHSRWTDSLLRQKDGTEIPVEQIEREVRFQGRRQTLCVARDMTVRQQMAAENTQLEQQLRQVQKMEAVGRLASGVAHDMNNILTAILAHAGLLKARGEESQGSWKAGDVIEKAAHRGKELTSQLLGFSRQGKHHHVPVDLHSVIQEVTGLLSRTVEKKIALHTELLAEEPWVVGDPNQLFQVLMNLAVNASDAMSDKGDLVFQTSNETVSAGQASHIPGLAAGDYVVVRVTDTGDGIPQEVQAHIFEPFFTTKELGRGSGMGLAMVYGIVKNHHGYIGVTSTLGVGTTMRVYLPSILCEVPQISSDAVPAPSVGTGHVLIIDDEEAVAEAAQAILEYVGYTTTICLGGREAVEYFQKSGQGVDLVLLDMVMPEMSGPECFAELRRIWPDSKILLCTGYDRNHAVQELLNQGTVGFIQKPYDLDELAQVCADAIQQPASSEPCLSGTPT